MAPDRSSLVAALFILLCGVGMICCGMLSDRLCRVVQSRKIVLAIGCSAISCVFLLIGFSLAAGPLQLVFIGIGMFFVAGITGPSGAVLANLTHKTVHGTAFATMTLTNNLLGLAPGPILTGVLADRLGLSGALQVLPLMSLFVIVAFFVCWKRYHGDLERNAAETAVLVSA
jgi:MFS family permease